MSKPLPIEEVIRIVRWAIDLVKIAKEDHLKAEACPSSTSEDRAWFKRRFKASENEFGWQWANVERILNERVK